MGDAPELIRGIEDAILECARRHPLLRGPWLFTDEEERDLQATAKQIRERRARPRPRSNGEAS